MTTIGLTGLPSGDTTVTVSQDNATATGTLTLTAGATAPQDAYFVAQGLRAINPALRPFAVTLENDVGNGCQFHRSPGGDQSFEPIIYKKRLQARRDHPHRIYDIPMTMSSNDLYRHGYMNGGTARVYRVRGGHMIVARESAIADWSQRGWRISSRDDRMLPVEAAAGYRLSYRRCQPGGRLWVTVFAVKTDGSWGAMAAPQPVDLQPHSGGAPSNPGQIDRIIRPATQTPIDQVNNLLVTPEANGQIIALTWDPVADAAGYLLATTHVDPSEHPAPWDPISDEGWYCELVDDGSPPIEVGDFVIVEHVYPTPRRDALFVPERARDGGATGNWRFQPLGFYPGEVADRDIEALAHPPHVDPTDGGRWFGRLTMGPGVTDTLQQKTFSGTGQWFYAPLRAGVTYRAEIWARLVSGAAVVSWRGVDGASSVQFAQQPPPLTGEWARITTTFTAPTDYTGGNIGRIEFQIAAGAEGCVIDVDGYRVYDDAAAYMDFLPEEYDILNDWGIGSLRAHQFIKSNSVGICYDLEQLTNEPGATSYVRSKGSTLPQFLRQCLNLNGPAPFTPWLQVEFYFSPNEWLGLVEYLAAPYDPAIDTPQDKPWAHKRWRQGRAEPWVDAFEEILWEVGNENWNPLFSPWIFSGAGMVDEYGESLSNGAMYGLFQEHVIDVLESSPYWGRCADKVKFVLGGWRSDPDFGEAAAFASPRSHFLMTAAYNGGWDEGESETADNPSSYQRALQFPARTTRPSAEIMQGIVSRVNAARQDVPGAVTLQPGTYEAGPGYAMPGNATQEEKDIQEKVRKSQATGVGTIDCFLTLAEMGYAVQNYFLFGQGFNWSSHTALHLGAQTHLPYQTIGVFSLLCRGDMVNVRTVSVPTEDLLDDAGRLEQPDVPRVACYAMRDDDQVAVVLCNRKLPYNSLPPDNALFDLHDDGYVTTRVDLPLRAATGLTLYRWAFPYDAGNTTGGALEPEIVPLSVPASVGALSVDETAGADPRGLPPSSVFIYVYHGVT